MENKTHWKKAFKSDYLSSSDVDGADLKLIIKEVKYQECITQSGKKFCNVAHFADKNVKPMILNVTNSKMVKKFAQNKTHIEDWLNIPIQVYVNEKVQFGSDLVEGLRIRPVQPTFAKVKLVPNTDQWTKAVVFLKGGGDIKSIKRYEITDEHLKKLINEAKV